MNRRFSNKEIGILCSLAKRGASTRPITLETWRRVPAIPLWRGGIVEIWYRQSPSTQPSLQGPYYGLTVFGAQIASTFVQPYPSRRLAGSQGQGSES